MSQIIRKVALATATFLVLSATAATASAEKLAGLQFEIGSSVDTLVRGDLESSVQELASKGYEFTGFSAARSQLNPIVKDCFTADCLKKAGGSLGADHGLRINFSGEAQIYDWSVEIYDLGSGEQLAARKGACELCGRTEVIRTFRSSLTGTFDEAKAASRRKSSSTVSKPTPKADPEPTPKPTPSPSGDRVTVVEVKVDVEPPDATINYDGEDVGRGTATLQLSPGQHELMIKADGYRTIKELVVIDQNADDQTMNLRIHLPKKDAPPEAVAVASDGPIDRMGSKDRTVYGIIGIGSGLAIMGIGAWLAVIDGDAACGDGAFEDCPEVYSTGGAAFVTTFTGATLFTAGAVLLAWDALAGESNPQDQGVKVAPAVSGDSAGIGIFGRF